MLFRSDYHGGAIDLSKIDTAGYFKDIGLNKLSHNLLAVPLYEVFCYNLYDHPKCNIKPDDVVFDVGSNIGFFTYRALYKEAQKIYSFEPNKELSSILREKYFTNVKVENVALSNETSTKNFYLSKGGISSCLETLNNKILKSEDSKTYHRGDDVFDLVSVDTINAMDYIVENNIQKIDYLKLDCEGAEYYIIDSLDRSYLRFNVDRMMIEYHYLYNPEYKKMYTKMIEKIKSCGFKIENNSDDTVVNDGVLFCWKE